MDKSWFDQFASDDIDFYVSDEDEDYVPNNNELESEEYDSDDEFLDQATREECARDRSQSMWSKDKKIEYSSEPWPMIRSETNLFSRRQGNILKEKMFYKFLFTLRFGWHCRSYNTRCSSNQ